jgi:glycosyltransferase involved in cell wall biosynthesis
MDDRISIIVSTFNRRKKLKRLLDSLSTLRRPCPLEFIIIDNCSDDGTEGIVRQWMATVKSAVVIYHVLPKRSPLVISRNAGIIMSTGSVIAFTDDDCVVDSRWIDLLYHRLVASPDLAGVGGKVLPCGNDIYSQYYIINRVLEPPDHINALIGANCMFWKQSVIEAGLFDVYFTELGGEEIALCMKLWVRGCRFGFEEQAIVYHNFRMGLKNFSRTFYRYGSGERLIYENDPDRYLRFMKYPEQIYDHLAFRNLLLFQIVFTLRMTAGIFRQYAVHRSDNLTRKSRILLTGLYAVAHLSYHLGRGTFSGRFVKKIRKYLAKNPEVFLKV